MTKKDESEANRLMKCNVRNKMTWRTGTPNNIGYYLCAVVGNNKPIQLHWDGSGWFWAADHRCKVPFYSEVPYYMKRNDIPMPEGW